MEITFLSSLAEKKRRQQCLNVMRTLGFDRKVCVYLPAGRQVYDVAKSYGFSFGQEKIKLNNKL